MDEKKSMELTKEQLDEVTGGNWDEENGFGYFEGTVVDMGGRTAFVRIDDLFCEKECTYDLIAKTLQRQYENQIRTTNGVLCFSKK